MKFQHDDGGREAAGYKGAAGDCVCRAVAIATGKPYREVYANLNALAKGERRGKKKRKISSARDGVFSQTLRRYMEHLGWGWQPTMQIGSGCTVHLRDGELPGGRLIVCLSRHVSAVVDGVIHDLYDPTRGGSRCVYGYFYQPQPGAAEQAIAQPAGRLAALEAIIESGMRTFIEVGNALLEIRDQRLYRGQGFSRFEDYCRKRWNMSRFYAHRLIEAAGVVGNLLPIGNVPRNEAQARELVPLPPQQQREVALRVDLTTATAKKVHMEVVKVHGTLEPASPPQTHSVRVLPRESEYLDDKTRLIGKVHDVMRKYPRRRYELGRAIHEAIESEMRAAVAVAADAIESEITAGPPPAPKSDSVPLKTGRNDS
jgi:hypothetical protein